jgi:Rrf2 family iron-sulfur cluster assembly transcriptional regulator
MFSQTSEYAVRALIVIARLPVGAFAESHVLAAQLSIPRHYLAKILQQLARSGLLESARGRTGGFRLLRDPSQVMLRELIAPFEDRRSAQRCILGQTECDEHVACPLHTMWTEVRDRYVAELDHRSLADLAAHDPAADLSCLVGVVQGDSFGASMAG